MNPPSLDEALENAELLHDREALEAAIDRMADAIAADYAGDGTPPLFVSVMHGGLLFAARLALALGERGLDLEFDYLHATRYRGATTGSRLAWLHRPAAQMRGRRVLLADDILDEGHTLAQIIEDCRAQGARSVYTAALVNKRHDRRLNGLKADFVGLDVDDHYVFGAGMDYKGWLRNLPGIYAAPES